MTKADRDDLLRLARARAKLAKVKAAEREKILVAEVEDLLVAEFEAEDQLWAEAVTVAEEAARKANEHITAQCELLGIPPRHSPRLVLGWEERRAEFKVAQRRQELRRVAQSRLAALTAAAKARIDESLLETETALIAGGLESGEARAVLESMPTADQLMPALSLDDLGVKTWQPPEGAAAALLTPTTTADRKRRKVLRAIEANPGASDRQVAAIAGVDHKTVSAYRRAREPGGELPAGGGELPTESGELPAAVQDGDR
jgi:hypothetical protein